MTKPHLTAEDLLATIESQTQRVARLILSVIGQDGPVLDLFFWRQGGQIVYPHNSDRTLFLDVVKQIQTGVSITFFSFLDEVHAKSGEQFRDVRGYWLKNEAIGFRAYQFTAQETQEIMRLSGHGKTQKIPPFYCFPEARAPPLTSTSAPMPIESKR